MGPVSLEAFGRTARVCSVRIGACTRAFALERFAYADAHRCARSAAEGCRVGSLMFASLCLDLGYCHVSRLCYTDAKPAMVGLVGNGGSRMRNLHRMECLLRRASSKQTFTMSRKSRPREAM